MRHHPSARRFSIHAALAIIVLTATAPGARADGATPNPFDKGTWVATLSGSYVFPTGNTVDDNLANVNATIGYFPWNHHSLSLELSGYAGDQEHDDDPIVIGGFGFVGRWHFLRDQQGGGRWSVFFDGGVAASYADQEYPRGGTTFNFVSKVGFGGTYRLDDHAHLIGGVRYFHISNAQIDGKDENPGYDAVQGWGGVMWTW
jgi:hypothetical protein